MKKGAKILLITVLLSVSFGLRAQLLTNLGQYRNQLFVNTGYYLSFANYSVGWFHNEHVKFLKRDVAGILDFSFPISNNFYTRFVFRKGFQANIWQDSTWRIPVAIIGSSDKVITSLFRIHNFVTDFFFNPGIYKRKYTIALDLDYKVIWFSHYHKTASTDPSAAPKPDKIHAKFAAGMAFGLNYKRFTYLIRTGYQQTADVEKNPYSFYAVLQFGYNCNFKTRKPPETKPAEEKK
ncbi:MAG TPA: hypothetical protein VNZ49_11670 [Bacteroidia bacterium]|nr:hypothetical protein [Bacteroidia bacterium]